MGTAVIPADSYFGTLEVTFFDDDLVDLIAYSLVLNLDIPEGVAAVGSITFTVNYNRYFFDFILKSISITRIKLKNINTSIIKFFLK